MTNPEYANDMTLYSPIGERLYLNKDERARFLDSLAEEEPENRMFCQLLHYTGCRPTEALELVPKRVLIDDSLIVFRSLKKRKVDMQGRKKHDQYRELPVPPILVERLDLVFGIRASQKKAQNLDEPIWSMSRASAWRMVKRVMDRAGIVGKQATGKGLRHGFGVAQILQKNPTPIHVLADIMGHTDTKTTEVYLKVISDDKRKLITSAWEEE